MNLKEAMSARHSVRKYKNEPLAKDSVVKLNERIEAQNQKFGLNMQLVTNNKDSMPGIIALLMSKGRQKLYHTCGS